MEGVPAARYDLARTGARSGGNKPGPAPSLGVTIIRLRLRW